MAVSAVGGIAIGPLRHTGLLWILTFLIACALIPLKGLRTITFPWLAWLPLYFFLGFSLTWTEFDWRYNIQLFVQMCVYPLIGIIASYTIRSEEELENYNFLYILATLLIGLFCVYYTIGPGMASNTSDGSLYNGFAERPAATSLIVVASLFLAQIHKIPKTAILMWCLCFGICILSASRMATVVLLLLWIIHPQLASLKTRIVLTGVAMVLGIAAFYIPLSKIDSLPGSMASREQGRWRMSFRGSSIARADSKPGRSSWKNLAKPLGLATALGNQHPLCTAFGHRWTSRITSI